MVEILIPSIILILYKGYIKLKDSMYINLKKEIKQ